MDKHKQHISVANRQAECLTAPMLFPDMCSQPVVADFSGGHLSSDGGALLLGQIDRGLGLSELLAGCFEDRRNPHLIEHSAEELVRQRLFGMALGYEDLNDHADLRRDPLLAVAVGKNDVLGGKRRMPKDRGAACASPATLNRLELGAQFDDRYRKLKADPQKVEMALVEAGVRCLPADQEVMVLDFDATDMPLHGEQEEGFFHGYYDSYCYLPLYCFCGAVPLWAQLRPAGIDASEGTIEALKKIVPIIRRRFPKVKIIVRSDSGFTREEIMAWCEGQKDIYYLFGIARNPRIEGLLTEAMVRARMRCCLVGISCREFVDSDYRTIQSWSCSRRLLGKAEALANGKSNPRAVITNIPAAGLRGSDGMLLIEGSAASLYENDYCGRGRAENMIKQMTLDLKADRVSSHWMAANQMRLWFAAFAYLLLERLRSVALCGGELATATLGSVRLRLLKVAAAIKLSARRLHVAFCSAFPLQDVFRKAQERLSQLQKAPA